MRIAKKIIIWSLMPAVCMSIMAGCQIFGHALGSEKIPTKHLLFIPRQGSVHLRWEARHLTIEFKGQVTQNLLRTRGRIDITGDEIQSLTMLDRLVVDIYFADSAGNVLDKQTFYSAEKSPLNNLTPRTITRSFKLPRGTSHIAFGYDGTAREGGAKTLLKKGDAREHSFQHSPFR
jgi:hypothetical protein